MDIVFQIFDLIAFFSIMLISKKYWTIFAGGIGLLEVATALARVVYPTTIWASETVMVIWFYSFLLAVLLATRRLHVHRRGATDFAFDAGGATDKVPVRQMF
jgi:hypothetical protein